MSSFSFQMKTKNDDLNQVVENKVEAWSKRKNFDIAGRHGRAMFLRLIEARAVLDGDCGLFRLKDGRVQAIEGDRIRTPIGGLPAGLDPSKFVHGVQTDDYGAALAYAVCKQTQRYLRLDAPSRERPQEPRFIANRDGVVSGDLGSVGRSQRLTTHTLNCLTRTVAT